jgi:hypothetical protein
MPHRTRHLQALRTMHYALEPAFFNRVRLSLMRLRCPLELRMEMLQVVLELDRKRWIAFSLQQNGMPLIQWRDFNVARSTLDQPVECTLLLYHYQSWLMFPQVLVEMDRQLYELLEQQA